MANNLLDALDWGTTVDTFDTLTPFTTPFIPFQDTAQYEGKVYICDGLVRKESQRSVLEPLLPHVLNGWTSDESSPSSEDEIAPRTFHQHEAVGNGFGPGGGNASVSYKVNKERATTPPVREMVLVTEQGRNILTIRPKCKPRRKVSRGCVELAVSEWMKEQRELPLGHPLKCNVQSEIQSYTINGEVKQVAVWLWRGLEQDMENPNVFRVYF